jgi:hypothetical protein
MYADENRFRWVQCQLDTLRDCRKRSGVLKALKDLPETLDETYARILRKISKRDQQDAAVVFALLAFSPRPISLGEAAEAVAIDLENETFNEQDRLFDIQDIFKICSNFVALSPYKPKTRDWEYAAIALQDEDKELRFAHYSVKEYFVSDRAGDFQIECGEANAILARLSLAYLLSINHELVSEEQPKSLPFLLYASSHWHVHAKPCLNDDNSNVFDLACHLFDFANDITLRNSIRVSNPDHPHMEPFERENNAPGLYFASRLGLFRICSYLIEAKTEVNAQGGEHGNALQAASYGGHEGLVQLLLGAGAEVNAQGGSYGNALQAASFVGHEGMVRLLLEAGADVHAQGGQYGNALQAA